MCYRTHGLFFSLRTAARPWALIYQFTNYQFTNLPVYQSTAIQELICFKSIIFQNVTVTT